MAQAKLIIDLGALRANWRSLAQKSGTSCAAVVKANAYGLGVGPTSLALAHEGARDFFVASAEEGAELRQALGFEVKVYVFSGHMDGDTSVIKDAKLIPLLNSTKQAVRHFESLPNHPFGVQLDTGMNRLGMEPEEWAATQSFLLPQNPQLIMSHLACADDRKSAANAQQLALFRGMTHTLNVPKSLSATGGILLGSEYAFDMVRPGIGLYGGLPFDAARPVVQAQIPIIQTRHIEAGEWVGYGQTYVADTARKIATLQLGYADGLQRILSQKINLFHNDTPCPLVGRISMDMIGVDVTHLTEEPNFLNLFHATQSIDTIADHAQTIGYEILTSFGSRYRRSYRA